MFDEARIQKAVRNILEAIGEDPSREGIKNTPQRVAEMYAELFRMLGWFQSLPDPEALIHQTEQYFKDRALEKAINESIEIIEKNGNRGEIETKIKDALAIEFITRIGHDYFEDVQERMAWYKK